ncbi:acyl-homoserine-lactone synthase [Celerinatantimonas yamalensis]|uniref:acyl-homoserine-lactone synthase n=1 Tax=Celerinatantimonas yamalensis TaxID=559956 RepID=A0ABW9GAH6_9GAMM
MYNPTWVDQPSTIEQLFESLEEKFNNNTTITGFKQLVEIRKQDLTKCFPNLVNGNLAHLFEHPQVIEHIQQNSLYELTEDWHWLEKKAIKHFGNILACWAHYEKFSLLKDSQNSFPLLQRNNLPIDEYQYQSEIVDRIELDSRVFYTLHCPQALSLVNAIKLINIDLFIIEKKWYEMLFLIELSQQGSHFLLYHTNKIGQRIIVSSALIQHWHERSNWLSFDPFFCDNRWQTCFSTKLTPYLYNTGVFYKKILEVKNDLTFFHLIKDKESICEVLRLTTSGSTNFRFFILFLCQKNIMQELYTYGKKLACTIIEQPLMLNLYKSFEDVCYINKSSLNINNNKSATYKGFWLITTLHNNLQECDYKEYKNLIKRKNSWCQNDCFS